MTAVHEFEEKVRAGQPLTRAETARLMASADLVDVGMLGEAARKARTGDVVTYGRVRAVERVIDSAGGRVFRPGDPPDDAGEIRLTGSPASTDEALQWVRAAAANTRGVPLTAFSLSHLLDLVAGDHLALAALAAELKAAGLEAVAEAPLDTLGDTENLIEILRALHHGGLAAWRATVWSADTLDDRLDLIERAAIAQRETGAFRALAPLPRHDSAASPSTGFDDVRTVAAACLGAAGIPVIQVDWPLYGPKLAQVAIAYGAGDVDGINAADDLALGHRRSPVEDIERQIRAAAAVPARRNGRFERLS
jgi:2-iminoacetate synthase ThiH